MPTGCGPQFLGGHPGRHRRRIAGSLDLVDAPELKATVLSDEGAPGFHTQSEFQEIADVVDDSAVAHREAAVRVRDTAVIAASRRARDHLACFSGSILGMTSSR